MIQYKWLGTSRYWNCRDAVKPETGRIANFQKYVDPKFQGYLILWYASGPKIRTILFQCCAGIGVLNILSQSKVTKLCQQTTFPQNLAKHVYFKLNMAVFFFKCQPNGRNNPSVTATLQSSVHRASKASNISPPKCRFCRTLYLKSADKLQLWQGRLLMLF